MAKVEYAFPVEAIHGKVSKNHKVGFARRQDTGVKFTQTYSPRITQPSETELSLREKFTKAVKATYERMADPTLKPQDLQAFKAQSKYKTLYGYVFSQVYHAS